MDIVIATNNINKVKEYNEGVLGKYCVAVAEMRPEKLMIWFLGILRASSAAIVVVKNPKGDKNEIFW